MMNAIVALCAGLLGATAGACIAAEPARTQLEQSLIGKEVRQDVLPNLVSSQIDDCKELGGYMLQGQMDLGIDSFDCSNRELMVFSQLLTRGKRDNVLRILDVFLLPKLKRGERLMMEGDCELNGKTDKNFVAYVALGRREKVTWKNGVHAAWAPNPETGKIEPISTRNIVCWRPTPP